jgi:SecD/SecF fusion protein
MLFYYNKAGYVADLALITNIFFIFGVLASLGAVLTLPGIAGIVLTLGMAVDANVIIYERIREELRAGKGLRLAIADGYKNAYSAIIDGNVTTLLTGIVLYIFGTGPVQGFATTLIIGICSSLFTAIFISRLVFHLATRPQPQTYLRQ